MGAIKEMMCVVCVCECYKGDGCDLASTLCKFDWRKGHLFVISGARVRGVRRGSISSELLICGGGVRSIMLLPLVARCLETMDVCIWHMFVFMSVVVTVWGVVGMCVVYRPLLKLVVFSLGVLKYVFVSGVMDVPYGCCSLSTSLTLVSGGSPMIPLVVHQPAYPSI